MTQDRLICWLGKSGAGVPNGIDNAGEPEHSSLKKFRVCNNARREDCSSCLHISVPREGRANWEVNLCLYDIFRMDNKK